MQRERSSRSSDPPSDPPVFGGDEEANQDATLVRPEVPHLGARSSGQSSGGYMPHFKDQCSGSAAQPVLFAENVAPVVEPVAQPMPMQHGNYHHPPPMQGSHFLDQTLDTTDSSNMEENLAEMGGNHRYSPPPPTASRRNPPQQFKEATDTPQRDNEPGVPWYLKTRNLVIGIVVIIIVVAAVVGGLLGSKSSDAPVPVQPPTDPPTTVAGPTTKPPTEPPLGPEDAMVAFFTNIKYSDGDIILSRPFDASSPAEKAIKWLMENTSLNVGTATDEFRLTQKFALLTFYYSTNGDNWTVRYILISSCSCTGSAARITNTKHTSNLSFEILNPSD